MLYYFIWNKIKEVWPYNVYSECNSYIGSSLPCSGKQISSSYSKCLDLCYHNTFRRWRWNHIKQNVPAATVVLFTNQTIWKVSMILHQHTDSPWAFAVKIRKLPFNMLKLNRLTWHCLPCIVSVALRHAAAPALGGYIVRRYPIATVDTWDIILHEIPANDRGRRIMVW